MTDRAARLEAARGALAGHGIDALLISGAHDRRYLSGFTGSAGHLLVTASAAVLATDFRYTEQAAAQAPGFDVHRIKGRAFTWLAELASDLGVETVGFDPDQLTVAALGAIEEALGPPDEGTPRMVAARGLVAGLRQVKDAEEIGLIERASAITDAAMEAVTSGVGPGMTEAQVAWDLERTMREMGAEALSFDIIVGAGENAALPHHRAGERVLREGDPVVIDMGCIYRGYCSDLTRTIFVGEPDRRFCDVYNTVLRAQLRAERDIRAGMTGEEADALARDVIAEAGHAERFGHSLGHGVGLEVHERPWMGSGAADVLADGMVFTVEPGIYIPGWGGVRIEDMAVMEDGAARVLSAAPKLDL